MADERDVKRSVIIVGTATDPPGIKEGDDIPVLDADVKAEIPPVGAASPQPLTLETTARYVKSITSNIGTGNRFPIHDGASKKKLLNDDGTPAAPSVASDLAEAFDAIGLLDQLGVIGQTFTQQELALLNDPKFGLHDVLRSIVSNSKAGPGQPSFDTSGRSVAEMPEGSTPIQKAIVSSVLSRNRFTSSGHTPFVPPGSSAKTLDQNPLGRSQLSLGTYDNRPSNITMETMKKVGLALMLRSTGQFIGQDGDPTDAGVGLAALLPGEAQLGLTKIPRKRMWASDLTEAQGAIPGYGKGGGKAHQESEFVLEGDSGSYGAMNTFIEPFDGFAPVGMIALGVALVVALKLLIQGFFLIMNALGVGNNPTLPDLPIKPMGSANVRSKILGGLVSMEDFGIHQVRHDYLTAANRGIDVFFQFDGTSFVRVIKSPGYYATLVRALISSAGEFGRATADAFSSGNPIASAQAVLGLVDVIKDSKIIGFFNILAGLGDSILTLEDEGILPSLSIGDASDPGQLPQAGKISSIDRLVDNAATHVMKSRADANDTKLAWRTSSTPSLYIVPSSVLVASDIVKRGNSTIDVGSAIGNLVDNPIHTIDTRINKESVQAIEDKLEAEYVPFYFHDLRTNEIVSFHAFLSAMGDSFAPDYGSDKYFGRVDPVMVYSNTARTITLSFHVVATNDNDFDVMWWKINKLITFLYPQWSRGNKLTVGQNTFIQPFSQVMTSSPVIRLRLGDVFKSNYSRFALARLFGLGTADFSLQGAENTITDARSKRVQDRVDAINKVRDRMTEAPTAFALGLLPSDAGYKEGEKAYLLGSSIKGEMTLSQNFVGPVQGLPFRSSAGIAIKAKYSVNITGKSVQNVGDPVRTQIVKYEVEFATPIGDFSKGPYIVNKDQLVPDDNFIKSLVDETNPDPSNEETLTPEQQAVDDFFSPDKNSIVRSFESIAGRGLAGVITSMNFDWKAPTWDLKLDCRAPQWCIINMNFQPIHDIAPGLDADGFNRAPVYNVGSIVKAIGGDPYDDGNDKVEFDRASTEATKNIKKLF